MDDRNQKVLESLTKKLFEGFMDKGVELITKQKKNTKKPGMLHFTDRLLLRKRAVIESVNDFLKNVC